MKSTRQLIGQELEEFEKKFARHVSSRKPLLDKIMRFVIQRKGKKMRPMFVFLSAKIAGDITESTYRAASLIELLHTATLVHDDVVDNAMVRRHFFSINALWKNKIAVLVGDYLLAKGLLLSVEHQEFKILEITSRAVKEISEGELLQIEKARRMDIEESVYFEIIRAKTATLLASACAAGAYSGNPDAELAQRFWEFGEKIGIAFQIKDDLFDYGSGDIGKPTGIDIKERKMTLPLIYALKKAPAQERKQVIYTIKNHNTERKKVDEVIEFVKRSGGIEYAYGKMKVYQEEALRMLDAFPDSPHKAAMHELVNYVIDRNF